VIVLVVAVGVGAAVAMKPATRFEYASARLEFAPADNDLPDSVATVDAEAGTTLVRSPELAARAAAEIGGDPGALSAAVETEIPTDAPSGSALKIIAKDIELPRAITIADAFANLVVESVVGRDTEAIQSEIDTAARTAASLEALIAGLGTPRPDDVAQKVRREAALSELQEVSRRRVILEGRLGQPVSDVRLVRPAAEDADEGFAPPATRKGRAVAAGILGLLVGGGLAATVDRLDPRLREKEQAERAFGLPVVAEIPRARPPTAPTWVHTRPEIIEAYRSLRTALGVMPFSTEGNGHAAEGRVTSASTGLLGFPERRVIVVTSAEPGDGKTTVVANLAAAIAETGLSVLVVSADARRPKLHAALGVPKGQGVTELARQGPGPGGLAELARPTPVADVRVVTSGSAEADPGSLGPAMTWLLSEARQVGQVVIVDTPPLLAANDAGELVGRADAVLLVARGRHTAGRNAAAAGELVRRLRAPVVGVALIGSEHPSTSYGAYANGHSPRRRPARARIRLPMVRR
jgi:Mrp family chromosome partitioning ATPase